MALETLAEYSPEEILPLIPSRRKIFKVNGKEFFVKTCSPRLQVFKRSLICVSCGLVGSIFKLQRQFEKNERPHLNLYAVKKTEDGDELILMTQDHIRPRSKGGEDHTDNLCTMCIDCNMKKGNQIII